MGSRSDWATLQRAAAVLDQFGVPHASEVVSAHRTPEKLAEYAQSAADRGLKVIIAGAGGAAHLPGMLAAQTHLPVLGVPVESAVLRGVDNAKFRKPVVPGDQMRVYVKKERQRGNIWKFSAEAKVDGKVVAEATYAAMILDR
jgi:acyl dehydratase